LISPCGESSCRRSIDRDHFVLEVIGADPMGNDSVRRRTYYHRAAVVPTK